MSNLVATSTAMSKNTSYTDWWQNALIYQIYPRSFMDSNADGIGDLRGIIDQLHHLVDISVDAIWLSPIFASPMIDFGYDISDYKSIHPDYGTMQDFEELLNKAKKHGIKVLLDFVPNHTSDQCIWFKKSVLREPGFEDFYVWSDGKIDKEGVREPPNNWISLFSGSAWSWHDKRQQYYLHQFAKEQPDLNYRNPDVLAAMDDVIHFWLDKGISGFRIDAFNHIFEDADLRDEPLSGRTLDKTSSDYLEHVYTKDLPELHSLVEHWRKLIDNYNMMHDDGETCIMMAEIYTDTKKVMDYYLTPAGGVGVHFPFNFIMITDLNADSDARDFVFYLQKWLTYMPHGHVPNWVMGNHDVSRVGTRFGEKLIDAMNMLLLTLPGVAVTYNGEEIGMQSYTDITWDETLDPCARNVGEKNYKKVSRDPARTPFQWNATRNAGFSTAAKTWLPVHKNYIDLNLSAQMDAEKSHYKVYKALAQLRHSPILRKGRTEFFVVHKAVFLLKRELKGQGTFLTVINLSDNVQKVDLNEYCNSCKILKVLITSVNSTYENEQEISVAALLLNAHESLVGMLLHA